MIIFYLRIISARLANTYRAFSWSPHKMESSCVDVGEKQPRISVARPFWGIYCVDLFAFVITSRCWWFIHFEFIRFIEPHQFQVLFRWSCQREFSKTIKRNHRYLALPFELFECDATRHMSLGGCFDGAATADFPASVERTPSDARTTDTATAIWM